MSSTPDVLRPISRLSSGSSHVDNSDSHSQQPSDRSPIVSQKPFFLVV